MSALGTEFKYGIRVPPVDGVHLEEYDFEVTSYVYTNKCVTFRKSDVNHIRKIDADSYKVIIDSESALRIGRGRVLAKVTLYIPDNDFPDGLRTEVYDKLCTGETIL